MYMEGPLLSFHLFIWDKINAITHLLMELGEVVKCSKWNSLGGIEMEKESLILCDEQPRIILDVHAHTCACVCTDAVSGAESRLRSKSQQAQEDKLATRANISPFLSCNYEQCKQYYLYIFLVYFNYHMLSLRVFYLLL